MSCGLDQRAAIRGIGRRAGACLIMFWSVHGFRDSVIRGVGEERRSGGKASINKVYMRS